MDLLWGDMDIIKARRQREERKRKHSQRSGTCNVCKKSFPSRNKLFIHLRSTNPTHMTESHYISYILSCKTHSDYEHGYLNVPEDHDIPSPGDPDAWRRCEDVYVKKIKIVPYYHVEKTYYVTDFDPEDLRMKRDKPIYRTILEQHRAQYA